MNNIFESIKPLKNNKSFYNQNGTYTAVGYIKGQKVKVTRSNEVITFERNKRRRRPNRNFNRNKRRGPRRRNR